MNELQELHTKSIARHVNEHAANLMRQMQVLEFGSLQKMPVENAIERINSVQFYLDEIASVLLDMLPKMPEDSTKGYSNPHWEMWIRIARQLNTHTLLSKPTPTHANPPGAL